MKELSIEEKAKAYDEAIEKLRGMIPNWERLSYNGKTFLQDLTYIFPELKESEDERIRKELIGFIKHKIAMGSITPAEHEHSDSWIAWLEKQGDTNETINKDEFAQGVLRGAAIHLMTWIDYNAAEGNMCLSNMECKDIEDALVSGNWDKIYAYIKKKLKGE